MRCLIIIGAGGHGKVVADAARAMAQWNNIVFVDTRFPDLTKCAQWEVVASTMAALSESFINSDFVAAIGNNSVRMKLYEEACALGYKPVSVIHPFSYVAPDTQLGLGTVVFAGAAINIGSVIGESCIINTGATIDHDCRLGAAVHISPGANLAGGVSVGEFSWLGIGSSVKQQTRIGSNVIVGAGATVVSPIESGITVVGTPARKA